MMRKYTSPLVAIIGTLVAILVIFAHPAAREAPADKAASFLFNIVEYFGYAVIFFLVFTIGLAKVFPNRKLARKPKTNWQQISHEIIFSLCFKMISVAVAAWIAVSNDGIAKTMYTDPNQFGGWAYIAASTLILFVIHDALFYWSHRLMHHKSIYNFCHRLHHESVEPTPFTIGAFHPIEGVIAAVIATLPVYLWLIMPWHPITAFLYGFGLIFFNVLAHQGFEIYPKGWHRWPIVRWKTTCHHHYMHHQRAGGNYGLYFRFWDKLCKTEFKDYDSQQDAVFERQSVTTPKPAKVIK
jgi:Delta7-sterol 5-desaturase